MEYHGTARLETKQLILRRFTRNDCEAFHKNVMSDPKVFEFFACDENQKLSETRSDIERWIEEYENPLVYSWLIEEKASHMPIGRIGIDSCYLALLGTCEAAYYLGSLWWGKGYAAQALSAVIEYMFSEGVYLIEAKHSTQNPASGKVMEKARMRREAVLEGRRKDKHSNKRYDLVIYSIKNGGSVWQR